MGGLFGKPKAVTPPPLPPVPEPPPVPEVMEEAGEAAVRKARRRRGFARTIITGSLQPTTKKKTVLG